MRDKIPFPQMEIPTVGDLQAMRKSGEDRYRFTQNEDIAKGLADALREVIGQTEGFAVLMMLAGYPEVAASFRAATEMLVGAYHRA